ncbi:MAG TPA: GspE/PulE family protein [Sedimentisphaerales bacterium]|jgi:type II secretory ATPase GspE/PulE/Tfp pilus assembly ATPase PilB-like protein|nr:GspE/PulE family protein [Sedimentisphaerales bacterium]HNU31574.1 GspE/PulE family protein [Sedimentisphaerales bacterium]
MQILGTVEIAEAAPPVSVHAGCGDVLSFADLPFNPLRLVLLIAWVYLCLYLVQRSNFSPLVPKKYRTLANLVTLLTGPFLLLTLFLTDTARRSRQTQEGFIEVLKRQVRHAVVAVRSIHFRSEEQEDLALHLLDSAGRSIDEIYGHGDAKRVDAKILTLTEATIADALQRRASDILIDPKDSSTYTVRLRVDGTLRIVKELDASTSRAIINSIKAIAEMDIAERRRPQDGGFMARRGDVTASFRVASAGALQGEKLSIRVLNKDAGSFTLAQMGLPEKHLTLFQSQIAEPAGMILVSGPTGSGKTTTMYAMLNEIDRFTRNVITVEDPIEAVLPQASQIEVNTKADITFAKTLRSVLRQDPDVISVGEIRDEETAEIALRAAQTGHLVTATIHCESNATAIIRLLDLGISPLLLSAGLNLLVSQRLVRRLCDRCKRRATLSDTQIHGFEKKGVDPHQVYEAAGCKHCEDTGYSGRIAILDLMVVDTALRNEIAQSGSLIERMRTQENQKGLAELRKAGLRKVVAGLTSLDEIKRVVG